MDTGKAIRVMIARNNTNQTQLSKKIEITRPYMSSLCNNERTPSLGMLEKISSALNCSVWELIKEAEK